MRNVIRQTVNLPASPEKLFEMYLDPKGHETITGKPAVISGGAGTEFQAFEGLLSGITLEVIEPTLIVQSWRSASFNEEDPDSTLILSFSGDKGGGQIDLIHLDVPDHDFDGVTKGWDHHYWTPWRKHLEGD